MAMLDPELAAHLRRGTVIPAHPLALTAERRLDERRQVALTRYYYAAGAGGIAVGVHTTQFAIHEPRHGLLEPVLALAAQTVEEVLQSTPRPFLKIAGIVGGTTQALKEAELAREHGYHAGLLSLAALRDAADEVLIEHTRTIAETLPIVGFYLQPAVGGRPLGYSFWRRFVEIPNVVAIKIAPFNRYQTLDVVRAVGESGRADEIALYTGNDDNIVADLLTEYHVGAQTMRIAGGLLGHWAVWTRKAVELLESMHSEALVGSNGYRHWLARGVHVTDSNAAIFDAANSFRGCIPGIHEILRRQGLLAGTWCLNPTESLSWGQSAEIDRVCSAYPHLNDDAFVAKHLDEWLK